MQRADIASANELALWLKTYLESNAAHRWMGTLNCDLAAIKELTLNESAHRAVGVYDTAEFENPAHAEIFKTEYVIEEADALEVKRGLLKKFNNGVLTTPTQYMSGDLFNGLPEILRKQVGLAAH